MSKILEPVGLFATMVKGVMVDNHIALGNVDFWVDTEGPWAGQLSFDKPTYQWDHAAVKADLTELTKQLIALF